MMKMPQQLPDTHPNSKMVKSAKDPGDVTWEKVEGKSHTPPLLKEKEKSLIPQKLKKKSVLLFLTC